MGRGGAGHRPGVVEGVSSDLHGAIDFETRPDWTTVRCVGGVTSLGEELVFKSAEKALDWAESKRAPIFSHYGSEFDILHLAAVHPLTNITYRKGKIHSASTGGAWLHSSERLYPDSLAKCARWLGMRKLYDASDPTAITDAEAEAQALNDCRILVALNEKHRRWIAGFPAPRGQDPIWPKSGGRTAIYLMESLEPDLVDHLRRHPLDLEEWRAHQGAHQGARTETWRLGYVPEVWIYDLCSSYAAGWMEGPVPVGPWRRVSQEIAGRLGVYYCSRVRQNRERLPVTLVGHAARYEGHGTLTSEEIAAIRSAGGAVEVEGGWVSDEERPMAQRLVDLVYPMKVGGVPWAKAILSSIHGKTIQELVRDTYRHTAAGYQRDRDLCLPDWYQKPLIGAVIYARARLKLWRTLEAVREAGWEVYACDTDSIHTNCPPDQFPLELGDVCGQWRLQWGWPCEACYCGPKFYALRRPRELGETPTKEWRLEPSGSLIHVACAGFDSGVVGWDDALRVAAGEVLKREGRKGLLGFRGIMVGEGLSTGSAKRALRRNVGGKVEGKDGWLLYR
jgi:hypothetical protein